MARGRKAESGGRAATAGRGADGRDEAIIAALAGDARMPVARIAERVGMSEAGARRRVSKMVADGTVRLTAERGDGGGAKAIVLVSAESASDISKISASLGALAASSSSSSSSGGGGGGGGGGARKGAAAGGRTGRQRRRRGGEGAGSGRGAGSWRATTAKIYEITGQHDIAIIMSAAGIDQINETIDTVRRVPGVTDTNTVIILRTVA